MPPPGGAHAEAEGDEREALPLRPHVPQPAPDWTVAQTLVSFAVAAIVVMLALLWRQALTARRLLALAGFYTVFALGLAAGWR